MSRRGRHTGPPISLFSFQDIITSVTAIMILMVLILTLELITRLGLAGIAEEDRRVARDLVAAVGSLQARLEELRSQSADASAAASRVASRSVGELEAERRQTQRHVEELRMAMPMLEARRTTARDKRRAAEADLVAADKSRPAAGHAVEQALRDDAAARDLEARNERERARQDALEAELAAMPRRISTLVFNPPPDDDLQPMFVEVSGTGIAVLTHADRSSRSFRWGILGPSSGFTRWLSTRDAGREYVVVMLRPSGLEWLEATRTAIETADFQLGLELVSEDMDIAIAAADGAAVEPGGQERGSVP